MKALRVVLRLGLLIGLGIAIPGSPTTAQTASPKETQPPASGRGLREIDGLHDFDWRHPVTSFAARRGAERASGTAATGQMNRISPKSLLR